MIYLEVIYLDEVIDAGGVVLMCDGSDWYDVSHAKHV